MSAKELRVKVVSSKIANDFIKKHHYSGTISKTSQLHFGVFLKRRLHGAISYGNPIDKRKSIKLVEGTGWHEMLELNRLAFDDVLPRNSESRALAVTFRLIKKNAPQIKWIVSFADATRCGDGAIYRATGFLLTQIKENINLAQLPTGKMIHRLTLEASPNVKRCFLGKKSYYQITGGGQGTGVFKKFTNLIGAKIVSGFQIRYIKPLKKGLNILVPSLPYSKIKELGAGMYKGKKL